MWILEIVETKASSFIGFLQSTVISNRVSDDDLPQLAAGFPHFNAPRRFHDRNRTTIYPQLPDILDNDWLEQHARPSVNEMTFMLHHADPEIPQHQLSLMLQLKLCQVLGYFPDLTSLPTPIVDYIRLQMNI